MWIAGTNGLPALTRNAGRTNLNPLFSNSLRAGDEMEERETPGCSSRPGVSIRMVLALLSPTSRRGAPRRTRGNHHAVSLAAHAPAPSLRILPPAPTRLSLPRPRMRRPPGDVGRAQATSENPNDVAFVTCGRTTGSCR
jgi:hypothetical protein